jgi:ADP-ribosylglycohydrolase
VNLTHKDRDVLSAADALVRILVRVCRGGPLREAILEEATDWISAAKLADWADLPDRTVVGTRLSTACYIPDAFPAALVLAWRHHDNFAAGVLANARCGGDNCHRGAVVGALETVIASSNADSNDTSVSDDRISASRLSGKLKGSIAER